MFVVRTASLRVLWCLVSSHCESPQHPTPPFPITVIIADHRSHAFLLELELPRPLCSLVTHPETYERDYLFRSLDLSSLSANHFPLPNDDAEPNLGSSQPPGCWTRPRTPTTTRQLLFAHARRGCLQKEQQQQQSCDLTMVDPILDGSTAPPRPRGDPAITGGRTTRWSTPPPRPWCDPAITGGRTHPGRRPG